MSDIDKTIELLEFGDKLRAIEAHCKQRLPGEWPISLDDKFIELMNDACQYFPYKTPSTKVLLSDKAPTKVTKNPIIEELETANKRIAGLEKQLDDTVKNQASMRDQMNWNLPESLED